jgi:hypothetical protein
LGEEYKSVARSTTILDASLQILVNKERNCIVVCL